MGRQKLKKSYQYEVKWRGLDHKFNTWVPREDLLEKGFTKLVQQFDDLESSREGAGSRETTMSAVRKHLEEVGLDGDIAQYNEMSGLSGGQKMKVVIAAALWNNPQVGFIRTEPIYPLIFAKGGCLGRSYKLPGPRSGWWCGRGYTRMGRRSMHHLAQHGVRQCAL